MKNVSILFRSDIGSEDGEEDICKSACKDYDAQFTNYRSEVIPNSMCIGRYSVLPFYRELESELNSRNITLANSYAQHNYIADIENYYYDIQDITPKTYFQWGNLNDGDYVVKGRTNSRKHQWNKQMFCSKNDIPKVVDSLMNDALIREQGLCVREYVPLHKYDESINGLPITNEWRLFYWKNKLLAYGYYWASFSEHKPYDVLPARAIDLSNYAAYRISQHTNFFVLDIAETENGEWIVIEVNDGQQSGLSMVKPYELYANLLREIY